MFVDFSYYFSSTSGQSRPVYFGRQARFGRTVRNIITLFAGIKGNLFSLSWLLLIGCRTACYHTLPAPTTNFLRRLKKTLRIVDFIPNF